MIVLGDLNDEVEAATTQILNGPTGSEIGTGGFNQPDHGDRQRLWNLAAIHLKTSSDQKLFRFRLPGHGSSGPLIRNIRDGTVNLSNPKAIFAGSPPRFSRSRVMYEAYVVSITSNTTSS